MKNLKNMASGMGKPGWKPFLIFNLSFIILQSGCFSFDNPAELEVPPYDPQLVVSCYLTPGYRYELLLTESQSAYEPVDTNTLDGTKFLEELLVDDALVTISHHGVTDTLEVRGDGRYWNDNVVAFDYDEVYYLDIYDTQGRELYGATTIAEPVEVDSVNLLYAPTGEISFATYFTPPDDGQRHYFFQLSYTGRPNTAVLQDYYTTDIYNGGQTPWLTDYHFLSGDNALIQLLHIHPDYYEFLRTYNNASESNFRPFSEPGPVAHNVTGGYGVFTGFDFVDFRVTP